MNTSTIPMKRHPMTAIAFTLLTVLAAGCNSHADDRDGFSAAPPQGPRMAVNGYDRAPDRAADRAPDARYDRGYDRGNTGPNQRVASFDDGRFNGDSRSGGAQYAMQGGYQGGYQDGPRPMAGSPSAQPNPQMQQLMQWERRDMGVAPTRSLHDGEPHGPTPNQIPGGQVITTVGVTALLQQNVGARVIDVLGAEVSIPQAIPGVFASAPGSFDDATQQQVAGFLANVTRNDPNVPLVFYCGGPECWMSYNAALRAIALGYRNVLWYRGGLQAWNQAGLPMARMSNGTGGQGGMGGQGMGGQGMMGGAGNSGSGGMNQSFDRG